MLTEETQRILCNLFITIAKGENNIKITRQALSSSFDFSPYNIFSYFTKANTKQFDSNTIYNYLNSNNIPISKAESKLIILFYDKNLDKVLSFEEFCNFIHNDKFISNNYDIVFKRKLSLETNIEFLLLKLFEKEMELAKNVISHLKKLKIRADSNIHNIYHFLTKSNYIDKLSLQKFLEMNNVAYIDSDLNNILRRLDINKDGVIDLRELNALLYFPQTLNNFCKFVPCNICKEKECDKCLYVNNINKEVDDIRDNQSSRLSQTNYAQNSVNACFKTNSKPNNIANSQLQLEIEPSFEKNNYTTHKLKSKNLFERIFEENKKVNKNSSTTPLINNIRNKISFLQDQKYMEENPFYKIYPKNYLNPNQKVYYDNENNLVSINNAKTNYYDIEKINILLKLMLLKELEIESEKISFMNKSDLNFEEIFEYFDREQKGYISAQDLNDEFDFMGINVNGNEAEIFMKRYDLINSHKLNKSDFFDALVPFDKKYRMIMDNRNSSLNEKFKTSKMSDYKNNILYLKQLFMFLISKEYEINDIKKKIYDLKGKLKIVFNLIDNNNKGYFCFKDLYSYFVNNKLNFESYAVALLFIRLDKRRQGKIEISDFMKEL